MSFLFRNSVELSFQEVYTDEWQVMRRGVKGAAKKFLTNVGDTIW